MNNPEGIKALVAEMRELAGLAGPFGISSLTASKWADRVESLTAVAGDAEALGWYTDDHLTDRSATTYDPEVAERWRKKGWPVTPFYATRQAVEGMVLVPREPTIKMHNAAAMAGLCGKPPVITEDGRIEWACADPSAIYRAMLAAAAPQAGKGDGNG